MRTSFVLLGVLFLSVPAASQGQNCSTFYPMSEGAEFELTNYNAKDKVTGKVVYQIGNVATVGGATEAKVRATVYDEKNRALDPMEYTIRCKDGNLYMDLKRFLNPEQMKGDMQFSGEASYLEIPAVLSVGSVLPDGSFEGEMTNGEGKSFMKMSVGVSNRKVEGQESITTPAGTFDAYKITGDVEVGTRAMGLKLPSAKVGTAEWYARDTGIVRSESYRKGKLIAYSVLTRLDK